MKRELSRLLADAERRGWVVSRTGGDHWKLVHRPSGALVFNELAARLRVGAPLADHDRAMAATVLEDAAWRHRPALAARLRHEALRTRNGIIFELGRRFFVSGSLRARARALIAAARLYRDGEWRHHRMLAVPPDSIAGTAGEHFWRAFKAYEPFPFGQRTIEDLIR